MSPSKIFYIVLGCISMSLGAVGAILPILPSIPFLLLATFCFAKSSERMHRWFVNTGLYKKNLESYVKGQGMTWQTKLRVVVAVTLLMGFGFAMMMRKALYLPCAILAIVWVVHLVYFFFCVKTKKNQ